MQKNTKRVVRDFHVHTMFSDGFYTPATLMREAHANGVREIAITDHNTVAGLPEGRIVAKRLGMRFLSGVEVTSTWLGKEVHMLGYGFENDRMRSSPLQSYMAKLVRSDQEWARQVAEKSQREPLVMKTGDENKSISVSPDELERFKQSSIPSYFIFGILVKEKLDSISERFRPVPARHIYYFLFWRSAQEYADRYRELFKEFGVEDRTYWNVPREESVLLGTEEAIRMISEVGAVPVLAHPGETGLVEEHIAELHSKGLRGLEVYTPKHDAAQTEYYERVASSSGLLKVCGTDFHDPHHRNKVEIGRDRYGTGLFKGATFEELSGQA